MKLLLLTAAAGGLCIAGCQSTAASTPSVPCDQASLQTTIDTFFHESDMQMDSFDKLDCSGDWAAVLATVSEAADKPAQQTFVFARSGEDWILKAPEIVCGSPTADNTRPSDAEIPADLWPQACLIA